MTFFNTKEEVIDIELTPYGKYLLSKGEFVPEYYEFFDDDIIYDSEYAGFSESQEEIQARINDTKRTKAQYAFTGADTRFKEYLKSGGENGELFLEKRKNFAFPILPLGNNSAGAVNVPSTSIRFRNVEISSSYATSLNSVPTSIRTAELYPQELSLTVRKKTDDEPSYQPFVLEDISQDLAVIDYRQTKQVREIIASDNNKYEIVKQEPYLLIDITESEIDLTNDNYEIYMYELDVDADGEEVERPLSFTKERQNVVNNILLDPSEIAFQRPTINDAHVNYYFNVLVDREIPSNILCTHLADEEIQKLVQVEGYDINCRKIRAIQKLENPEMFISEEELRRLEEC
jgi:hypothetical protein